ncbi:MAG: leucine-rich repeat protein [Muribaculaceae bacterium]|nr:leucine-rich repeat protein [Muribaculaceae bacterium]
MRLTRFLLAVVSLLAMVRAQAFEAGGVSYALQSDGTVWVVEHWPAYSGEVTIPPTVSYNGANYRVTGIARRAFAECIDLTAVTLPESLRTIEAEAFLACTSLAEFKLPNSVTTLGVRALADCYLLQSLDLGTTITEVPYGLCQNANWLARIDIPDQVTTIGSYAFANCKVCQNVVIGDQVVRIDPFAFDNCTQIRQLEIKNLANWCKVDFENYRYNPLSYSRQLVVNGVVSKKLVIPEGVGELKPYAFTTAKIDSVVLPQSLRKCDMRAFYKSDLKAIDIPDGVTELIGVNGLEVKSLNSVAIGAGVSQIANNTFLGYPQIQQVTLREGIQAIGRNVFSSSGITELVIPNSVTVLDNCFGNCGKLRKITIGTGLREFRNYVFHNDSLLAEIHIAVSDPNKIAIVGGGHFSTINTQRGVNKSTCVLYVPRGAVERYRSHSFWRQFAHIEEDESAVLPGDANGSGMVDIDDVNILINVMLGKPAPSNYDPAGADTNGDGRIDIDDVNYVINVMLHKD